MNIVIAGGGIASISAAEAIRKTDKSDNITIITEENYLPYQRIRLSSLLGKDIRPDDMLLKPKNWFSDNSIDILINKKVLQIDPQNKEVQLSDESTIPYDKLIIAIGGHSFKPPVKGSDIEGVFTLKTLDDAYRINTYPAEHVVIIGGGLLGLEAAWSLKQSGKNVSIVEFFPRLLPRQLDEKGSIVLKKIAESYGFRLYLGAETSEITGEKKVEKVTLKNGDSISCDMVLFSTGIRSNLNIAKDCGIATNRGIIVNNHMKTSIDDIYAAGDVAEYNGKVLGIWPVAREQGRIAGLNCIGNLEEYTEIPPSNTLNVMGTKVFSIGDINNIQADANSIISEKELEYYRVNLKDNMIQSAILLGNTSSSQKIKKLLDDNIVIENIQEIKNIIGTV